MPKLTNQLCLEANNIGIKLSEGVISQVEDYLDILRQWRQAINLSSISDPVDILRYHFLESFYCCNFIGKKGTLADVGSGAGFPGIAIKLLRPELKLWLIEPRRKRAFFLKEIIRRLDLRETEVVQQRVEALDKTNFQDVHYITSRATGRYEIIASWARKVMAAEGIILLFISDKDTKKLERAGLILMEKHKLPTRREGILALCKP